MSHFRIAHRLAIVAFAGCLGVANAFAASDDKQNEKQQIAQSAPVPVDVPAPPRRADAQPVKAKKKVVASVAGEQNRPVVVPVAYRAQPQPQPLAFVRNFWLTVGTGF